MQAPTLPGNHLEPGVCGTPAPAASWGPSGPGSANIVVLPGSIVIAFVRRVRTTSDSTRRV